MKFSYVAFAVFLIMQQHTEAAIKGIRILKKIKDAAMPGS